MAEATNSATSAAANGWAAHYSHSVPKLEPTSGVHCTRLFSKPGVSPYCEVNWERRTASITDATGGSIFEQKDVEVPVDGGPAMTGAGPGRQPSHPDLEIEDLAGRHLTSEPRLVDTAEQRQPPGETGIGQNGDPPQLGQRLHHENAGQGGPTGEVPGEEGFLTGQMPTTTRPLTGLELHHLVDEQKWRAMGKKVLGAHHAGRGYRR